MRKKTQALPQLLSQPRARLSTPVLRTDGKISTAWDDLRKGQHVEVYQNDVYYGSGEIDGKTSDSEIVWILHDDGQPRRLYFQEDGFAVVVLDPDPSLVQHQDRAIARRWS